MVLPYFLEAKLNICLVPRACRHIRVGMMSVVFSPYSDVVNCVFSSLTTILLRKRQRELVVLFIVLLFVGLCLPVV